MLYLTIPAEEGFDNKTQEFKTIGKDIVLQLEHSLVSLSKWEAIHHKPFLSNEEKTLDEIKDYIKCMTITQNVPDEVYNRIKKEEFLKIQEYIKDEHTATWFNDKVKKHSNKIITSEVIYFWMIENNIPYECQKWHLGRLLTLIRVCSEEHNKKPMKKSDILRQQAALNRARRRK